MPEIILRLHPETKDKALEDRTLPLPCLLSYYFMMATALCLRRSDRVHVYKLRSPTVWVPVS